MEKKSNSKAIEYIRKSVGRAINRYGMIHDGDRVAVAVSGGKDSFVLLETLSERRKFIPVDYEITAVHVAFETIPYEINRQYFDDLCGSLNVPIHYRTTDVDIDKSGMSPCFLCSRQRRKMIFDFAAEQGCNRVALGHHGDDAIETLFLNMVFQGSIGTMPPKLSMFDGEFDLIRPLILLKDYDVRRYARLRGFPGQKKECPYGENSKRNEIRNLLHQLYGLNRKARSNIFRSMSNIHTG